MDSPGNPRPSRGRARGRVTAAQPAVTSERTLPPTPDAAAPSTSAAAASTPATEDPQPQAGMQQLRIEGEGDPGAKPYVVAPRYGYKVTKPETLAQKQSKPPESGAITRCFNMVTNYFNVINSESFSLHQYMVNFDPPLEDEQTMQRKGLFRTIAPQLPGHVFDGFMLFTVSQLPACPTVLMTNDKFTNNPVTITIDCHKVVDRRNAECFQIYNIFVRKCLEHCKFVNMGRNYFDPSLKEVLQRFDLNVWPGFATSLRYFENALLLNVEMVSKVVREKSVFTIMQDIRAVHSERKNEEAIRKLIEEEVEGRIVVTPYNNNRNYPIDKILWDEKVTDTFPCKDGSAKSYLSYFKERYGITLQHRNQPLLLVAVKERDFRRGKVTQIKLIPEICFATGLTDSMRSNFQLMTALGNITHVKPGSRVSGLIKFIRRFTQNDLIKEEMNKWNIRFDDKQLVKVQGKQLKEEKIYQGAKEYGYDAFTRAANFRDHLHEPLGMSKWIAVVPQMCKDDFTKFLNDMKSVSKGMHFRMAEPKIVIISRPFGTDYLNAVQTNMREMQGKLEMVFVVLPNNKLELYSAIKQRLTKEWALPSQCCLSKNLKKGLSVASKIVVQISCKIGGVPWIIKNPFTKDNICIIGFDVFHSPGLGGSSYGAIVATTNKELSKCCSFIKAHKHREEVSSTMGAEVTKCLKEYQRVNGCLPTKIFFYRDGVGEGQIDIVYGVELESTKTAIANIYGEGTEKPKLAYIIVSKRINTRFMVDMGNGEYDNPPQGTVVDDVVTLHYRYDFFLVSQKSRQGTVSPTNYNIIYDEIKLPPVRMQAFTFKLCHNYYNWNGTLSVPSVCQNAHKLAYITGEAVRGGCAESLRNLPWFL